MNDHSSEETFRSISFVRSSVRSIATLALMQLYLLKSIFNIDFLQAYSRLCNPELICLKREIAVSKGQTVECMTVRHFKEDNTPRVEVWVGSGQADDLSAQVTIIDLCDKGVEVNVFFL